MSSANVKEMGEGVGMDDAIVVHCIILLFIIAAAAGLLF